MESLQPSKIIENSTATKPSPTPEDTLTPPTENAEAVSFNKKGQKRKRKTARLKKNQNTI